MDMHRFTDRSRKVLALANQAAKELKHEYVATEHLLLGLIREGAGVACNVLRFLNIDAAQILQEINKCVQPPDTDWDGIVSQTPRMKQALEYAQEEMRNLGHNYLGTEHLLLGLLRVQECVSTQILLNLGVSAEEVRKAVLDLLTPKWIEEERDTLKLAKKCETKDAILAKIVQMAEDALSFPQKSVVTNVGFYTESLKSICLVAKRGLNDSSRNPKEVDGSQKTRPTGGDEHSPGNSG